MRALGRWSTCCCKQRLCLIQNPHVDHRRNGWLSSVLVPSSVAPERHDWLTVGDELLGHHSEIIADCPSRMNTPFDYSLRTDVGACFELPHRPGDPGHRAMRALVP